MIELIFFSSAIVAILLNVTVLAVILRVPAPRVAITTTVFTVVFFLLPPHWFSGLMITLGALGSILSHWIVGTRNRTLDLRGKLTVKKAGQDSVDKADDQGPITPFPAINQSPGTAAPYSEMGEGEQERTGYDRAGHPTKRASSKRAKRKRGNRSGSGEGKLVSTSDLPTAEKPTIEEYLKPKSNFFDD